MWLLDNMATVQQILDAWEDKKKPLYTTILKKLQIMEQKKIVTHKKEGKAYQYIPLISREQVSRGKIRGMLKNFFGGNKLAFIHSFLDNTELDTEEISAVRNLLLQKERRDSHESD